MQKSLLKASKDPQLALGADIDDGRDGEDDESQHGQQAHQVGVQNRAPITIKTAAVVGEQGHSANPPKRNPATRMVNSPVSLRDPNASVDIRWHTRVHG